MENEAAAYGKVLSLSQRMLENVRNGEWDEVSALGEARKGLFIRLSASVPAPDDSEISEDRKIKRDLILEILSIDEEISDLVQGELAGQHKRLDEEKQLLRVYGFTE